jgi:hypothetical protein
LADGRSSEEEVRNGDELLEGKPRLNSGSDANGPGIEFYGCCEKQIQQFDDEQTLLNSFFEAILEHKTNPRKEMSSV